MMTTSSPPAKSSKSVTMTTVQALFEKVATRISSTDNNNNTNNNSVVVENDIKLRLYGLYKFCTIGEYSSKDHNHFSWNPTEIAKRRAWQHTSKTYAQDDEEAMMAYVQLSASLDSTCDEWLRQFLQQQKQNKMDDNKEEEEERSNNDNSDLFPSDQEHPKGSEDTSNHHHTNNETPCASTGMSNSTYAQCNITSSNKVDDNTTAEHHTVTSLIFLLSVLWHWIRSFLPQIQPVVTRGSLDLSWADWWFVFRKCLLAALLGQYQYQQTHTQVTMSIQDMWSQELLRANNGIHNDHNDDDDTNESTSDKTKDPSSPPPPPEVVVGYSVRSLLDLYLMHKRYPPPSSSKKTATTTTSPLGFQNKKEVIVVPPITIPGMIHILEYHGLAVVPVDTTAFAPTRNNTSPHNNRNHDNSTNIPQDLVSAVQAAMTERTVAILVVHPFGTTSATNLEIKQLRRLVQTHNNTHGITSGGGVEIWEDSAECYRGIPDSLGSPYADVTFLSFGLIKTATALGGGIAILRNHYQNNDAVVTNNMTPPSLSSPPPSSSSAAAATMRRLQQHHYSKQTIGEYFWNKVVQSMLIQFFSHSPFLYGCFVRICLAWGGYACLDRVVTRNVRSIVVRHNDKNNNANKMGNMALIQSIRKQPCLPLLQLLHRRLRQSKQTALTVQQRIQRCRDMNQILQQHVPSVLVKHSIESTTQVPVAATSTLSATAAASYWLYPIQVEPGMKMQLQEYLLYQGWDVASGTSQLQCVHPTPERQTTTTIPQHTHYFMKRVLYLPVASRHLNRQQCTDLAQKLRKGLMAVRKDEETSNGTTRSQYSYKNMVTTVVAWLPVFFLVLCTTGNCLLFVKWVIIVFLPHALTLLCSGFLFLVCLGYGLQWLCGSLYLQSSTGFARFNSMLDIDKERIGSGNKGRSSNSDTQTSGDSNAAVMDAIASLKLPSAPRKLDNDFCGSAILTGATGFVGSLLLRDLLLHRKKLNLMGGVYVICRPKRSKSARERIDELLNDEIFAFLTKEERQDLVHVIEGDVTKPNANIAQEELEHLLSLPDRKKIITHVIHSAAAVSFTQELDDAARANISSALTMQELTRRLGDSFKENENIKAFSAPPQFVHLSTAFVHGALSGSKDASLPEELFSLEPYDPFKLYESMLGSQFYAARAMSDLRFHNTYAFTKCVCEHLLVQRSKNSKWSVPTTILRPSIVGPALEAPYEGWAGQKPSTIVAAGCLYFSYQWNLWCFGSTPVPCIPVDVLSRYVLAKAFEDKFVDTNAVDGPAESVSSSDDSFERVSRSSSTHSLIQSCSGSSSEPSDNSTGKTSYRIHTAAWSSSSSLDTMFTWLDYCGAILQVGSVMGHFSRSTAYIGLWVTSQVVPHLNLTQEKYESIHYFCSKLPLQAFILICQWLGWANLERKVAKLALFVDLPLLFFPYMNNTFYFESDLTADEGMDADRYAFSCSVAAHHFVTKLKARAKNATGESKQASPNLSCFFLAGAQHSDTSSLWSSLIQPRGNFVIRMVGWLCYRILNSTCHALTVDLTSFEHIFEARMNAQRNVRRRDGDGNAPGCSIHVVLAPTHRSFLDFIILSYLSFAIPELHVDIPAIAAADNFESLPFVGWLARLLGAFYLRRGRGLADPELASRIASIKTQGPSTFEVFLEGARSRDRRFLTPKTGFLRTLNDSEGQNIIVPISISYEKVPEQQILALEAAGTSFKNGLNLQGLCRWLKEVALGQVCIGRVHVQAGESIVLNCKSSSDFANLAKRIQLAQQKMICFSEYHIRATAELLDLSAATVEGALTQLGCKPWPGTVSRSSSPLPLPGDDDELCAVLLQNCCILSKLCRQTCPKWALWFNRYAEDGGGTDEIHDTDPTTKCVSQSLFALLQSAESRVEKARAKLAAHGFLHPNPRHLLQAAWKENTDRKVPGIFLRAAVTIFDSDQQVINDSGESNAGEDLQSLTRGADLLMGGEEHLGFWGFHDSGFAMKVDKKGSHYVTVRGSRYALSGKSLSKLLPFVESETHVRIDPFKEAFKVRVSLESEETMNPISRETLSELQSTVTESTLSLSDRIRHGTGHAQEDIFAIRNNMARNLRIPDAVVWVATEDEVVNLINLAKRRQLCLIPFGGGTNVTQSTRCPSRETEPRPIVSVDMTKMNRVIWLNEEDGLAHVEAGINGRDLVSALGQRGYTIGHEPDSIEFSTLGGWIATKASGMKRNKYGNIEDIVRDVRIAGSEGMVWQKGDGNQDLTSAVFGRESCGMDLQSMILGSEGCLGIITSAVVKVWPLPEVQDHESVLLATFENGLSFVRDVSKLGNMIPVSVRLLDNEHFRLGQALQADATSTAERIRKSFQAVLKATALSSLDPKSLVCTTICYEGTMNEVQRQKAAIRKIAKLHGGILLGPRIGKAGYDLTFMIAYLRDFAMTYHLLGESFETFAPWSRIDSIIKNTKKRIRQEHEDRCLPGKPFVGCRVTQLYHDGACLYFYFCMNTENVPDPSRLFAELEHAARSEIMREGGSLSHHHGIGKVRSDFLKETTTPAFQKIAAAVKNSLDPDNIFAAGNGLFAQSLGVNEVNEG